MSIALRPRALACFLSVAVWVAPIPETLSPARVCAAQEAYEPQEEAPGQMEPGQEPTEGMTEGDAAPNAGRRPRSRAATKKSRGTRGGSAAAKKSADTPKSEPTPAAAPETKTTAPGEPSFAKDVAPILVANCAGCHQKGRPGMTRGKLDLTTFEKMMQGAAGDASTVLAGKPEDSHMVLRVKGEETPRMPQGNDTALSTEAIARIEAWVKAGAKLDSGIDPKAVMASYASSPEQMQKAKLAALSPKERDQKIEAAGRERWKKANPELKPEIESGEHFMLFSNLSKDRAANTLKAMEAQYAQLKRVLGPEATDWAEKASLYVFADRKDYVEFVRTLKQREVDSEEAGDADLRTPQPYVVVVDPNDSGVEDKESAAPKRKTTRGRREDRDSGGGTQRTLAGLLTENLGRGAVLAYDKSPTWLAEGFGVYLANQIERRGAYYQRLRETAFEKFQQGWNTKANETLGGGQDVTVDEFRAVSFALVECLTSPNYRRLFPELVKGMSKGGEKLDDVIKEVYGVTREDFLQETGNWVAMAYGGDR